MAVQFDTLIKQVITILTSYFHDTGNLGKDFLPPVSEDAYRQGYDMYDTVRTRFNREADDDDGLAKGVLENFRQFPQEYDYNLRRTLASLFQKDADFINKLRQIVSRPLFIGRDQELQEYTRFLRKDSPWIWIFTALERSGKTELLKQMEKKTRDIPVIRLDFAGEQSQYNQSPGKREPINAVEYLKTFADKVKKNCDSENFEYFEKEFKETYKNSTDDFRENIITFIQNFHADEKATVSGNSANITMDPFKQMQEKTERTRMTSAFFKLMESFKPNHLVIQLDSCEWLMEPVNMVIKEWLKDTLLKLYENMHQKQKLLHVVMMSSVPITLLPKGNKDQEESSLDPLDRQSVQQYLERVGVEEPELCEQLYNMTEGHAFCVLLLCQLWQQWGKAGKPLPKWEKVGNPSSDTEALIQFQKDFYEQADKEFISKYVLAKFSIPNLALDKFDRLPFYELTRYGIVLREFNLPLLMAVFSDLLSEPGAKNVFDQLVDRLYFIKHPDKQFTYAMHELFRAVLGLSIRVQEPTKWLVYHNRAIEFFKDKKGFIEQQSSSDWHYHNLAYLVVDDNGESVNRYWTKTLKDMEKLGIIPPTPLLEAACDKTLMFTSVAFEAQKYKQRSS